MRGPEEFGRGISTAMPRARGWRQGRAPKLSSRSCPRLPHPTQRRRRCRHRQVSNSVPNRRRPRLPAHFGAKCWKKAQRAASRGNRRRKRSTTRAINSGRVGLHAQWDRKSSEPEVRLQLEDGERKTLWALEGVSSIQIDFQTDAPATTFRSLGDDPRLTAIVIDRRRVEAAAWGLGLLVGLVGVGLTFQSARRKAAFVITVLLAATLPLLVTTAFDEVALVFDYVFFAGCWLIVWYLAAAIAVVVIGWARRLWHSIVSPAPISHAAALLLAGISLLVGANTASAQTPPWIVEDTTPVAVPADAIIVPYDPERPIGEHSGHKLLVPYARYVELWNAAHPDKKIDAAAPPVPYGIAGVSYEATLKSGDYLSVTGKLEIDVYDDKPIAVPLPLAGGVLVERDGRWRAGEAAAR